MQIDNCMSVTVMMFLGCHRVLDQELSDRSCASVSVCMSLLGEGNEGCYIFVWESESMIILVSFYN